MAKSAIEALQAHGNFCHRPPGACGGRCLRDALDVDQVEHSVDIAVGSPQRQRRDGDGGPRGAWPDEGDVATRIGLEAGLGDGAQGSVPSSVQRTCPSTES